MRGRQWDPFDELATLRESMDRLCHAAGSRGSHRLSRPAMWEQAVKVLETDADVTVRAELPGIDPKEVKAVFRNGILEVRIAKAARRGFHAVKVEEVG